jgi:hypothetical protein
MHITIHDEVIGMTHCRKRGRYHRPDYGHFPHRAITAPVDGFQLGPYGMFHRMRGYAIEDAGVAVDCDFEWRSFCGVWRMFVRADGYVYLPDSAIPGLPPSPWCTRCTRCEQMAERDRSVHDLKRRRLLAQGE